MEFMTDLIREAARLQPNRHKLNDKDILFAVRNVWERNWEITWGRDWEITWGNWGIGDVEVTHVMLLLLYTQHTHIQTHTHIHTHCTHTHIYTHAHTSTHLIHTHTHLL